MVDPAHDLSTAEVDGSGGSQFTSERSGESVKKTTALSFSPTTRVWWMAESGQVDMSCAKRASRYCQSAEGAVTVVSV
ncbi:hypothetical protein [Actinacidiphila glaucinigra]